MLLLLIFIFILVGIIWLLIELVQASTFNSFLDNKIMRRFLWVWLPFFALWRLLKEVVFKEKK